MAENKGPGYRKCPGVPELNHTCTRRIRSRTICPDCEKAAVDGRVLRTRRCPGVPEVGHSCTTRICSRVRCRICETIYDKYQDHLAGMRQPKVKRWCLKCGREFNASNRFLRLCKGCRESNRAAENNGYDESMYAISVGRGG